MICCFRASSQALVISNCVLCTLCCRTSLLVVAPVSPSGIALNYPGFCGYLNYEPVRIRYRDGRMNRPSKPFTPHSRSLWTDPAFVFSLKWASWMSVYVSSHPTLVRKVIGNEELMSIVFYMEMVLDTYFLWWSLVVCIYAVRKRRRKFGLKHFFVSGAKD